MATILVVDDSPVDRHRAGAFLASSTGLTAAEKQTGLKVVNASNGEEALAVIERQMPDAVVTDLCMPGMNGLELVEAIKRQCPFLPVILMTAFGSEDIALRALQGGAAGYVPKRHLSRDLFETVQNVLEVAQAARAHQHLLECLTVTDTSFSLDNEPALVGSLVAYLSDLLAATGLCGANDLVRVSVALREAMLNAVEHGNLEASSDLRELGDHSWKGLLEERRRQPPYRDRRVHVRVQQTPEQVVYVIRDEGPGFDPSALPDPTDPANLERASGRGLLLIRTFMDEVRHNATGNEITLWKRRMKDEG